MSAMIAIAAALATQAPASAPRGLSLREAQTLPAPALLERVLGAVGGLYTEIERPSPAIVRGRAFAIAFASTPRSAGYPGLCEADTITVDFGPAADGPATTVAYVQSVRRRQVYRIVGDTAPLAGRWTDAYRRTLAAQCAAAGPVLSVSERAAPRFFGGSYNAGSDFWAPHAYFGALVLAKASAAAANGAPVACRDDASRPEDPICDDPSRLLRNLPMERFFGFRIDRCAPHGPELCVTAHFARDRGPRTSSIEIEVRTSLSEVLYPPPDFALREIRIAAYTVVS